MNRSSRTLLAFALAALAALAGPRAALASGTVVRPPGATDAPKIDLSGVPESASVQKLGPDGSPHQVHARLLADRQAIHPGETFRLGVHLEQQPGWHTYWKSPGAVGKPTEITWQGPAGTTFSDYAYPTPDYFELSGIVSYGYEDQVLLYSEVTVPADLPLGEVTFGATAEAKWLVCELQCVPGDADMTLSIPVVAAAQPTAPTPWAPLFDHFALTHPVDASTLTGFDVQGAVNMSAVRPGDEFKAALLFTPTGEVNLGLHRERGAWPFFTPISTQGWMAMGDPVVQDLPGGAVRITVDGIALDPQPGQEAFGGLFQLQVGDQWYRTEITTPIPIAAEGADVSPNPSPLFDTDALTEVAHGPSAHGPSGPGPAAPPAAAAPIDLAGLIPMLGLAFLGGILLNIMPCVLPVLTLKLYSLVEQADISAAERRRAGMAYTGGILASFLILAIAVVLLRQSFGMSVGWGFQFQYPGYVIALGTIVFVFALNLFGVFEVPVFGANQMSEASDKDGMLGYFLTGAFATLLATPCSAPFLGTGMGFAFTLPSWGITLFFLIAGLGLAFPFLVIAFVPALFRFMPRPGAWMETFKQFLGFTLVATTIWLVDVVASQTGREGATGYLIFLTAVALGAWIFGRFGGITASGRRQALALALAVGLAAFTGRNVLKTSLAMSEVCDAPTNTDAASLDFRDSIPWQPFSEQALADLEGKPVFIDFTADWCLTCKVNEKNVLDTEGVRQAMASHGFVPLRADWTRRDETISAWLSRYGKAGVPFYLVIPADRSKAPIPLPEVITPDLVKEALGQAG